MTVEDNIEKLTPEKIAPIHNDEEIQTSPFKDSQVVLKENKET